MVEIVHILLVLPDGKVVLQRRDSRPKVAPNKLACFGGHVDPGEPPDTAMRRELGEETSLDAAHMDIRRIYEYDLRDAERGGDKVHFYLYKTNISSPEFEVHEGVGAETYTIEEALARDDIVKSVQIALTKAGD